MTSMMSEELLELSAQDIAMVSGGMLNPPPEFMGIPETSPGSGVYKIGNQVVVVLY